MFCRICPRNNIILTWKKISWNFIKYLIFFETKKSSPMVTWRSRIRFYTWNLPILLRRRKSRIQYGSAKKVMPRIYLIWISQIKDWGGCVALNNHPIINNIKNSHPNYLGKYSFCGKITVVSKRVWTFFGTVFLKIGQVYIKIVTVYINW